ncbi:hypothetical protein Bca52824_058149 [Brassica carinata]|uniref:Uncharacterized protein n=1 Tax=Brassica carinata TaxID=52824 RepID=A0A8X7UEG2_BRACI|nr:hypothetical protein Bca52824_058149 [Brassica carinata]
MDWSSTIPRSSESTKREHSKKSKTLLTTDDADLDDDAGQDSPEELDGNTLSSLSNLDNMNRKTFADHHAKNADLPSVPGNPKQLESIGVLRMPSFIGTTACDIFFNASFSTFIYEFTTGPYYVVLLFQHYSICEQQREVCIRNFSNKSRGT